MRECIKLVVVVNLHLQAGCITKEGVSGSKGYLRFPVRLPGLCEEGAAQRQEQGQIDNMPTHAGPLNPGGRQLLTGALYSSGPDKVPPLPGGVSELDTVIRNPEDLHHVKATYVHSWNTTLSTNRFILSIIHNLPTLCTSGFIHFALSRRNV
jgi:hypothetical protein